MLFLYSLISPVTHFLPLLIPPSFLSHITCYFPSLQEWKEISRASLLKPCGFKASTTGKLTFSRPLSSFDSFFFICHFAGVEGIEPSYQVLETCVLPLNYTPVFLPFLYFCLFQHFLLSRQTRMKHFSQCTLFSPKEKGGVPFFSAHLSTNSLLHLLELDVFSHAGKRTVLALNKLYIGKLFLVSFREIGYARTILATKFDQSFLVLCCHTFDTL